MATAVNPSTGEAVMLSPEGEWVPTKTVQNPQTGERMIFNGTGWEPMKVGADPKFDASDVGTSMLRGIPLYGGVHEQNMSPADLARAKNFDVAHPYISGASKLVGGGLALAGAAALLPEEGAI